MYKRKKLATEAHAQPETGMTFTDVLQEMCRQTFIDDCHKKAWSTACHADWISKETSKLMEHYQKLQSDIAGIENEIEDLEKVPDWHTVATREKRCGLESKRGNLKAQAITIAQHAQKGHQAMQQLLESVESALALAKHAETWEWREANPATEHVPES